MDTNTDLTALNAFFRLQINNQVNQAATTANTNQLSDAEMRDVLQDLAAFNTGLLRADPGLGANAVALPDVQPMSDMGSMSTADLLLLIRAESRKTTDLLVKNTTDGIKAQEASIDDKRIETNAKLDEAAKAMEKAERLGKVMKIGGAVLMVVSAVATIATMGAASPLLMVAMGVIIAASTIPVPGTDGQTLADLSADALSDLLQNMGMNEKAADRLALGIVMVVEIVASVGVASAAASAAGASTAANASANAASTAAKETVEEVGKEVAKEAMETVEEVGKKVAKEAIEEAGEKAVKEGADEIVEEAGEMAVKEGADKVVDEAGEKAVKEGADKVVEEAGEKVVKEGADEVVEEVGEKAVKQGVGADDPDKAVKDLQKAVTKAGAVGQAIASAGDVAMGGVNIAAAKSEYNAQMANADIQELKATMAYLQGILESDAEFTQMLMDISAQLDGGVANIVNIESRANENRTYEAYS